MKIGEIVGRLEMDLKRPVGESVIRFYEREGLIDVKRGEGGQREYTQKDYSWILQVLLLIQVGFEIKDVKAIKERNGVAMVEIRKGLIEGIEKSQLLLSTLFCDTKGDNEIR